MTHEQLVKVFPDGRTVHLPTDGTPLKGYELARADIEKRATATTRDDQEQPEPVRVACSRANRMTRRTRAAPSVAKTGRQACPGGLTAAAAAAKSADTVPMPRVKAAAAATLQLASADAQIVQPAKPKANGRPRRLHKAEAKPQTPADIINARGFWGDAPTTPKQATPAQVAAISARQALASADPQPTASVSALQALAYAPAAILAG